MESGPVWCGPHQNHDARQVLFQPWMPEVWSELLEKLVRGVPAWQSRCAALSRRSLESGPAHRAASLGRSLNAISSTPGARRS